MNHRLIPKTSLSVSPICLGTMTFGNPVPEKDAIHLVHGALDHGINFMDTADMYEGYDRYVSSPGGVAEEILGKALQGRRERAILTTKVGSPVSTGKGLGRRHIFQQMDASLRRLRTSYVDLYELHRPDPDTPLVESIAAMVSLMDQGKARHWGFSNFDAGQIREMISLCDSHAWPHPVISQPAYSWLKRDVEKEHLSICRKFQIGITPYQPLQGGLLTGKYRKGQPNPLNSRAVECSQWLPPPTDELYEQLAAFEREAKEAGMPPAEYAVYWLLNQPGIYSVVVGAKRTVQLEDLLSVGERIPRTTLNRENHKTHENFNYR